jgi:hypothetical protein
MCNEMWPGVCPAVSMLVIPGTTSAPGLIRRSRGSAAQVSLSGLDHIPPPVLGQIRHPVGRGPEIKFDVGDDVLGVRVEQTRATRIGRSEQMVGMRVGEDHGVDVLQADLRGGQAGRQPAGGGEELAAGAGVDQDQPVAGVHGQRVDLQHRGIGRLEVRGQDRLDLRPGGLWPEILDRERERAARHDGQFKGSDPEAIDARNLLARRPLSATGTPDG